MLYNSQSGKAVMDTEFKELMQNNTWMLVDLHANRKPIGCKWVFRLKENPDGSILKLKAKLVTKGFNQVATFDYSKTFSHVAKPSLLRIILTRAKNMKWLVHQIDVNNALLNGDLHEEVYMAQLYGFEDSKKD